MKSASLAWSLLLVGLFLGGRGRGVASEEVEEEEDECPRYSLEEFKHSVFDPVFSQELSRLKYALDGGIAGLADLMDGLGSKGAQAKKEEIDKIKAGKLLAAAQRLFQNGVKNEKGEIDGEAVDAGLEIFADLFGSKDRPKGDWDLDSFAQGMNLLSMLKNEEAAKQKQKEEEEATRKRKEEEAKKAEKKKGAVELDGLEEGLDLFSSLASGGEKEDDLGLAGLAQGLSLLSSLKKGQQKEEEKNKRGGMDLAGLAQGLGVISAIRKGMKNEDEKDKEQPKGALDLAQGLGLLSSLLDGGKKKADKNGGLDLAGLAQGLDLFSSLMDGGKKKKKEEGSHMAVEGLSGKDRGAKGDGIDLGGLAEGLGMISSLRKEGTMKEGRDKAGLDLAGLAQGLLSSLVEGESKDDQLKVGLDLLGSLMASKKGEKEEDNPGFDLEAGVELLSGILKEGEGGEADTYPEVGKRLIAGMERLTTEEAKADIKKKLYQGAKSKGKRDELRVQKGLRRQQEKLLSEGAEAFKSLEGAAAGKNAGATLDKITGFLSRASDGWGDADLVKEGIDLLADVVEGMEEKPWIRKKKEKKEATSKQEL